MKISSRKALWFAIASSVVLLALHNVFNGVDNSLPDGVAVRFLSAESESVADPDISRILQAEHPVIVTLVTETTDIGELCQSMRSLIHVRGSSIAPVIAFHVENEADDDRKKFLKGCTDRVVLFDVVKIVDRDTYPDLFTPDPNVDYTRAQINRFWTTGLWNMDILGPYDIVMRIDHDTCFSSVLPNVPGFSNIHHVYSSQYFPGDYEPNVYRLAGMFDFVKDYITEGHIFPLYTKLWQHTHTTFNKVNSIPNFQDSFEISSKSWMQSKEVSDFHYALTDTAPFGYYTQGWNVDAERFLTASIFGTSSSIDIVALDGFVQKDIQRKRVHPKICHFT